MRRTSQNIAIILFAIVALANCISVAEKSKNIDDGKGSEEENLHNDIARELANKYCSADRLAIFVDIDTSNPFPAVSFASKEIKSICPAMDFSCCNFEQLNTAANEFLRGYHEQSKISTYINGIIEWLAAIGSTNLLNVIRENNAKRDDLENFMENAKKEVAALFVNLAFIHSEFPKVQRSVRKYYAGFICEFCHPNMYDSFHDPQTDPSDKYSITFRFGNLLEFKDMLKTVNSFLAKHWSLLRVVQSLKGETVEDLSFEVETEDSLLTSNNIMDECFKKHKTIKEFGQDDLCAPIPKVTGLFYDFEKIKDFVTIYQYVRKVLIDKFRLNPTIIFPDDLVNKIVFHNLRPEKMTKMGIEIEVMNNEGFNMVDNKLHPRYWESAGLIKAAALFLAALLMM